VTVTESFASWALALRGDAISPTVRAATMRHLLDGVGCALAAVASGAGEAAVRAAAAFGREPSATIIGDVDQVPAPAAALANGALVHALDFDDTHPEALVHVTYAVLPAAFAAGEARKASGAEVLVACVAGYAMAIRLGAAIPHAFHARGFHATSVCGVFGGTLAAARLYGLTVEQTVNALGIAGSLASGSLEFLETGSSTKALHPGLAGMNAITATNLAAAGVDGPSSIIEGKYGLYATFAGAAVDASDLVADLDGATAEIERISIKPYPLCQLSVPSLAALRRALTDLDVNEIDRITFDVPPGVASIVCDPIEVKRAPRTSYEAKFSLPFCAAVLALDGQIGVASFAHLDRLDTAHLAARIDHRVVDVGGAPAEAPGVVTIALRDGTERTVRTDDAGGPRGPLPLDVILEKFHVNAGGRSQQTERLADDILGLEHLPSLAPIFQKARR
jgi:2-methylcitrate dehydratase PrpD